ncbi:hypothetical protein Lal_00031431 [Lupinus albus]|nr:hypothetical protein Lal_00031431 [Lupinus albus]
MVSHILRRDPTYPKQVSKGRRELESRVLPLLKLLDEYQGSLLLKILSSLTSLQSLTLKCCMISRNPVPLHPINPEINRTYHRSLPLHSKSFDRVSIADTHTNIDYVSMHSVAYSDFVHFGENPHKHLKEFHIVYSTMKHHDVQEDHICLKTFSHSLEGPTKVNSSLPPGPLQSENIFLESDNNVERAYMSIRIDSRGCVQTAPIIRFSSNSYFSISMRI